MEGFDDSGWPLSSRGNTTAPSQSSGGDAQVPELGTIPGPRLAAAPPSNVPLPPHPSPLPFYAPLPHLGPPPASIPTPPITRPFIANAIGSPTSPPNYAQWPPPNVPLTSLAAGQRAQVISDLPGSISPTSVVPPAPSGPILVSAVPGPNAASLRPERPLPPRGPVGDMPGPAVPQPSVPAGSQTTLLDFLCQTPLFQGCQPAQLEKLPRHVDVLEFASGSTLLKAGAASDWLGVLFQGRATAQVIQPTTKNAATFATLQRGDYFGEIGVLSGAASPFTVTADESCRVLRIPAPVIAKLAHHSAPFGDVLSRRLAAQTIRLLSVAFPPATPAPVEPKSAESKSDDKVAPPLKSSPETLAAPSWSETKPKVSPFAVTPFGITSVTPIKIPYVEVSDYDVQPKLLSIVPTKLMLQHRLLPLKLSGQTLTVGLVTPKNPAALAELRNVLATFELDVVAIGADDFSLAATRLKLDDSRAPKQARKGVVSINPDSLAYDSTDGDREPEGNARQEDPTKLVNRIIAAGLEREASDIHVETTPDGVRVRYRVNGVLQDWGESFPPSSAKPISSRIKVLAGMDITDRRLPQDGRIGVNIGRRGIDLRVSTLPANRGEKIVMRLLEAAGSMRPLDQIFIEPGIAEAVRRSLNRPFGGIIIAGPTGSGKSSSMYSMLAERRKARPDTNIVTVEDPIEYRLQGVTQVQVNGAIGLGFPQVLRSMLRQDPDVIVVGETRDEETAKLALEGAITGHLLLTSLHANTALAAIQRLESLGCSRALISQSLALVLVQRLVRKLCQQCLQTESPPQALLDVLVAKELLRRSEKPLIPRSAGCEACNKSGFAGRAIVLEALQITDEIRNNLSAGRDLGEIGRIATQTEALISFRRYAAFLIGKNLISASDALLTVAD